MMPCLQKSYCIMENKEKKHNDYSEVDSNEETRGDGFNGAHANPADEVSPEVDEVVPEDVDDVADAVDSDLEKETETLREELAKEKREYLFLMAEFDNFRKRTLREKSELVKNAGEQVLKGLLPIVDDFERGLRSMENVDDVSAVKEGMVLIYNKLKKYLEQNGVKEFDPDDKEFDADRHEAISVVPVADDSQKGRILDTVEKGYMLNDKVLRHAKVVVGQ